MAANGLNSLQRQPAPGRLPPAPGSRHLHSGLRDLPDKLGFDQGREHRHDGCALQDKSECLLPNTAVAVLKEKIKRVEMLETNCKALAAGHDFIDHYGSRQTPSTKGKQTGP